MPGMAPRNAIPSLPTSSSQEQLPLSPFLPTHPSSAPAKNMEQCTSLRCSRVRNRFCTLKMCKKCCTSRPSGCSVTSHSTAKLRQTPVFALQPASGDTPLPTNRGWDALDILIDHDPTIKLFRTKEKEKNAEAREHQLEEECGQGEDVALAAAIAASLASPTPPPSTSMSLTSEMQSFQVTLPPSAPLPTPTLPAVSQKAKKLPTITNHLDSNWRRAYNDRSKDAQARKGKAQGDSSVIQKFFIMFWTQVCHYPWLRTLQL